MVKSVGVSADRGWARKILVRMRRRITPRPGA
jgi:hypothetical protein